MTDERAHTIAELARLIPVTERALTKWAQSGTIKATKIGGMWFVPHDEYTRLKETAVGVECTNETGSAEETGDGADETQT